jgi:hypothetical protein
MKPSVPGVRIIVINILSETVANPILSPKRRNAITSMISPSWYEYAGRYTVGILMRFNTDASAVNAAVTPTAFAPIMPFTKVNLLGVL